MFAETSPESPREDTQPTSSAARELLVGMINRPGGHSNSF